MAKAGFLIETRLAETPQRDVDPEVFSELLDLYQAHHSVVESIDWCESGLPSGGMTGPFSAPYYLNKSYPVKAIEAIGAGDFLNIQYVNNILIARLATSNAKDKWCNAYAITGGGSGTIIQVQTLAGLNQNLAGLAVGTPYFLDTTPGQAVAVPGGGLIAQLLGHGYNATSLLWRYTQPVEI